MKWITFEWEGNVARGRLDGEIVVDFSGNEGKNDASTHALACGFLANSKCERTRWHTIDKIRPLLPIIDPDAIICLDLNYIQDHDEKGCRLQLHQVLLPRFANAQIGHFGTLQRPLVSKEFDYGGELTIVIGRVGRHIHREYPLDYAAGYACYKDASVRGYQPHTHRFAPGRNVVSTGGFNPWKMSACSTGDIRNVATEARLNGQIFQDAGTTEMISDISSIIENYSPFTRLEQPVYAIATRALSCVGAPQAPTSLLKHDNTVEIEIEVVGHLTNLVVDKPVSSAGYAHE